MAGRFGFPMMASRAVPPECMLQVLQREGLYNVVCVVTRYFGGILLGAGGLVRAYTKGAKIGVDAAGKSMKRVWSVLYLPCPYPYYERVKLEVESFGGMIRTTDFGSEVELELLFPEAQVQPFLERLTDMTAGTVEAMETGKEYRHSQFIKEDTAMTVKEELEHLEHRD